MSKSALYYKILKVLQYRIIHTPSGDYAITNVVLFPGDSSREDSMYINNRHVRLMLHVKNKHGTAKVLSPEHYDWREVGTFLQDYLDGKIEEENI